MRPGGRYDEKGHVGGQAPENSAVAGVRGPDSRAVLVWEGVSDRLLSRRPSAPVQAPKVGADDSSSASQQLPHWDHVPLHPVPALASKPCWKMGSSYSLAAPAPKGRCILVNIGGIWVLLVCTDPPTPISAHIPCSGQSGPRGSNSGRCSRDAEPLISLPWQSPRLTSCGSLRT